MCISRRVRPTTAGLFFAITLFFSALSLSHPVHAEMVDKIVAVVNDDVITLSDLEREGEPTFRKIAAKAPSDQLAPALAAARAEILETMIDKQLITQKAAAQKITVTDAEVDAAFANVMQRTHMTREQLLAKLDEAGVDEAIYKETLRTQILQNKLVGSDISSKIVITDDMVLDYYDTHYVSHAAAPSSTTSEDGYYLLQIGCSFQGSNKNEARDRIQKAHNLVKAGEDFKAVARKFSDLPSRADGGDIGTFELDDMAANMRHAVAGLQAGEISEIIETPEGYQFFKLLSGGEVAGPSNIVAKAPFEEVKDKIKQELFDQEMKKAYAQWVKELKDQAYIQKL
ncbi:peptidylprolyl isomerase [Desulfopila aestuarii]|uniref:Periplasmic chaperone for outer membrane proteins SurA n=1 Tax=Desulfopila aestuarii DSM 18488 TaxID=1121416 RepID=A0A1M7YAT1_9BACT|nr:peptidylprolyl isomerase [Desulfopila aestuarii]SHO49717.1 periplasmic chaperone for outer membrane proteins SurA [Desulfopila aestuarii DSM 18488]